MNRNTEKLHLSPILSESSQHKKQKGPYGEKLRILNGLSANASPQHQIPSIVWEPLHVTSLGHREPLHKIAGLDKSNASCQDASCPQDACNIVNTDAKAHTCQYTCWNGCKR